MRRLIFRKIVRFAIPLLCVMPRFRFKSCCLDSKLWEITLRLSWNEIRLRAAAFSRDWDGRGYEKGETQLFYSELFNVFGMSVRRVAAFEEPVKKLGEKRGYIDLFWKGVLLVEQKSKGRDLAKAKTQALDYFPGISNSELPRYLLVSDFQSFEITDFDEGEIASFKLSELSENIEKFSFILGVQKRTFRDQDPVNIEASELVGTLHDALKESGYVGHHLEQLLVRLVFCLFSDDTGIFETRDIFLDFIETRTNEDGSDLGGWLSLLFQVLNTPETSRPTTLDEDLARFSYINGDLFRNQLTIPSFTQKMRARLIEACEFDWTQISPAIFGSLFQSVMDAGDRRAQGAHYTSEKNILKVIEPLFLDDLRAEFERLKARKDNGRKNEINKFHMRLGALKFLDPACGCGNFLIIAYRELRLLEIDVLKELVAYRSDEFGNFMGMLDVSMLSIVDVDQFYGIEISEFPVRIAETSMWMMDHIMNNRLSLEFGQSFTRIPLKKSPHIRFGDALELDWSELLPPHDCSFVMGNPPFIGAKTQTPVQREQVRKIAKLGKSGGTLDYVSAWFIKAGHYIQGEGRVGFVSTNSITQGEQVAQLWPILFDQCKMEISFAHRTFEWSSEARGKANVHVVIVGLDKASNQRKSKYLFTYETLKSDPVQTEHKAIAPYLFDASLLKNPHLVISETPKPLNGLPKLRIGTQPVDGGYFIFSREEREQFISAEPQATPFIKPFIGAREFLHGEERFILCTEEIPSSLQAQLPLTRKIISDVREWRTGKKPKKGVTDGTLTVPKRARLAVADTPSRFYLTEIPDTPFLIVPRVSSGRRDYIPVGWSEPPVVPSDAVLIGKSVSLSEFSILSSAMHMAWLRNIGGRLKSDPRYSIGMVYNTFPMPTAKDISKLSSFALEILKAREVDPDASLANMYDPDFMPINLRKAHKANDLAVDKLYRRSGFSSELERVEYLFALYEKQHIPLLTQPKKRLKR